MSVNLSPVAGAAAQFLDNSGNVLTGGKLYTYAAGTTTPQATYTSNIGVTFHSNPIILDAAGRVPGGEIWLTDGLQYKFVLKDANDVLIGTYDNIIGINSNFLNYEIQEQTFSATQGQTVFTLTTITYTPGTNTLSVYVNGSKQIVTTNYIETNSTTVTFVSGLNVGDVVDFTTAITLSAGVTSANLVTYTPAGASAVATTVQAKLREFVSVKDFGATGNGITDDTAAIQSAINYVQGLQNRPTILLPVGIYKTTATLTITGNNVSLVGLGTPSAGAGSYSNPAVGVTRGATIYYTGSGNAITIGVAPGVNGTFINEIWLENLRIEVQNNSTCGLYVWMCSQSYFKNINVFGNKSNGSINQFNGTGNAGITIAGSISTIVEQVDITGFGQTNGSTYASYLNYGLVATAGYLNSPMTTTTFRKCYVHYCNVGAFVANLATFEDCIFEASDVGISANANASLTVYRGWWEANGTYDAGFAGNNYVVIKDSRINAYARQQFFNSGAITNLVLDTCILATTNANPFLFGTNPVGSNIFNPSLTYAGEVVLNNNVLPINFQIGYIYNTPLVNLIQVENMRKETYRFTAQSVGASSVPTMTAVTGFSQYTMVEAGHLLEVNIYTSSAITAGAFDIAVIINGTNVAALSYPTVPVSTTSPFQYRISPYIGKFVKGDVLTVYFHTNGSWSPSNNVCFEVIAAHGPDGVIA